MPWCLVLFRRQIGHCCIRVNITSYIHNTHLLALVLKTKQNMILSFNFWCQFGAFCQSIIASLLAHKSLFTRFKFPIQQNEYSDPSWLQKYTDKLSIVITMLKAKTALLFKQDRFSWLFNRVCTLQRKVIIGLSSPIQNPIKMTWPPTKISVDHCH